jgi:NAD(P)H-dependent FMN reductase
VKYGVINGSLNPESKGEILSKKALEYGESLGMDISYLDMKLFSDLPFCDGSSSYSHPKVKELYDLFYPLDGFIYSFPVYNYTGNAFMKNLVELIGKVFTNKVLGLCAMAGSDVSFLSPFFLTHSFVADFQTIIVPKYVLASYADIKEGTFSKELFDRVEALVETVKLFTESNEIYINRGRKS